MINTYAYYSSLDNEKFFYHYNKPFYIRNVVAADKPSLISSIPKSLTVILVEKWENNLCICRPLKVSNPEIKRILLNIQLTSNKTGVSEFLDSIISSIIFMLEGSRCPATTYPFLNGFQIIHNNLMLINSHKRYIGKAQIKLGKFGY